MQAPLQDSNLDYYPVLIEYKGYKDKLAKLNANGIPILKKSNNDDDYKTINSYAVNGAIHYAKALLQYTSYEHVIAIGMTGYEDEGGILQHEIGVYYVSGKNFAFGQKAGDYTDFSFLKKENFDAFVEKLQSLNLTQEAHLLAKEERETEIT